MDHRHKPQGLGSNWWPLYPWKNQSALSIQVYWWSQQPVFLGKCMQKAWMPTAGGSVHPEPFPTMFTMSLGTLCHLLTSPWLRLIITSSQFPYSSDPNQIFLGRRNPLWQTPLAVSSSGVRSTGDLRGARTWKSGLASFSLATENRGSGFDLWPISVVTCWHASLSRSTQRRRVYTVGTWEKFTGKGFQKEKKNSWINKETQERRVWKLCNVAWWRCNHMGLWETPTSALKYCISL